MGMGAPALPTGGAPAPCLHPSLPSRAWAGAEDCAWRHNDCSWVILINLGAEQLPRSQN